MTDLHDAAVGLGAGSAGGPAAHAPASRSGPAIGGSPARTSGLVPTALDDEDLDAPVRPTPRRRPLRWVAVAVILVLVAMGVHAVAFNANFQWSVVGTYLFSHPILFGLLRTLELTVVAMVIGVVLGVILAVMRISPNHFISKVGWLYVWFFRGTPVLVQLIFWYNLGALFPKLSLGVPFGPVFWTVSSSRAISSLTAAILGLGLNEAAYMAEIVRGGIAAVDPGQTDAAHALGMSRRLAMKRIVLPQAMRYIIPPTGNEVIGMLKTTSLASVVALAELLYSAQQIYTQTFQTIPLLVVVCIWYLVATTVLMVLQSRLERYYGRGSGRDQGSNLFRFRSLKEPGETRAR